MPAIGARTTGVSTLTLPRVRAGMAPLSGVDRGAPKSRPESVVLLALVVLPLALVLLGLLGLGDLAGPRDRGRQLLGSQGDRIERAPLRCQVDQADLDLLPGGELGRERLARAGLE